MARMDIVSMYEYAFVCVHVRETCTFYYSYLGDVYK